MVFGMIVVGTVGFAFADLRVASSQAAGSTLEIELASTEHGGSNAPKCLFKQEEEECKVIVKNTGGEALTVANPQFAGAAAAKFEEINGAVVSEGVGLPECRTGTVIAAAGGKCGRILKSKGKGAGPGKGCACPFKANWIFEGQNAGVTKAQATTFLEWTE